MRTLALATALLTMGCAGARWPNLPKLFSGIDEYSEKPRSYLALGLESDSLIRVKPWERNVLARDDMSWEPDPLEAAFREHTFWSKEATPSGASGGGGGCGCN